MVRFRWKCPDWIDCWLACSLTENRTGSSPCVEKDISDERHLWAVYSRVASVDCRAVIFGLHWRRRSEEKPLSRISSRRVSSHLHSSRRYFVHWRASASSNAKLNRFRVLPRALVRVFNDSSGSAEWSSRWTDRDATAARDFSNARGSADQITRGCEKTLVAGWKGWKSNIRHSVIDATRTRKIPGNCYLRLELIQEQKRVLYYLHVYCSRSAGRPIRSASRSQGRGIAWYRSYRPRSRKQPWLSHLGEGHVSNVDSAAKDADSRKTNTWMHSPKVSRREAGSPRRCHVRLILISARPRRRAVKRCRLAILAADLHNDLSIVNRRLSLSLREMMAGCSPCRLSSAVMRNVGDHSVLWPRTPMLHLLISRR